MSGGRWIARATLACLALACAALAPGSAVAHWGLCGEPAIITAGDTLTATWEWSAESPFAAWQLRDRFDGDGDGALSAAEREHLLEVCLGRAVREAGLRVHGEPLRDVSMSANAAVGLDDPVQSTAPLSFTIRVRGVAATASGAARAIQH